MEDGIVWYKMKVEQLREGDESGISGSWSQPIMNNKNMDIQIVKSREDVYYHIMSFLSKIRDDVEYVEKFEFSILEYLGINNEAFESKLGKNEK